MGCTAMKSSCFTKEGMKVKWLETDPTVKNPEIWEF